MRLPIRSVRGLLNRRENDKKMLKKKTRSTTCEMKKQNNSLRKRKEKAVLNIAVRLLVFFIAYMVLEILPLFYYVYIMLPFNEIAFLFSSRNIRNSGEEGAGIDAVGFLGNDSNGGQENKLPHFWGKNFAQGTPIRANQY